MLQQMRKYTKSWVSSLFLGILALSFGVWGIADIFRGNSDTSVATVGGESIPMELFQRDYRNVTRAASRQGPIKPAQARAMGQKVLEGLINEAALDSYIRHYGITVPDEVVSARIRAMPYFQGTLGTFDRQTFQRAIDQAGFTEQSFIEYIRGSLERDQLIGAAAAGLELPPGYARAVFNYLNEARAVQYISLPASAAGAPPVPSDAQLQAFIAAHRTRFSTPEYREVTYAWIAPEDLASKVKISEAQLQQQYDAQKGQYVIPEKRQLEQITFPDLASAKAARAKIGAGTSFADLAKTRGLSTSEIQIGALSQADLGDRGTAVFALQKDGVSQPLKAPVGYALIHVVSITPGSSRSFAEVKEELRKALAAQLEGSMIADIGNKYIDENSRGQSLQKSAALVGMRVAHIAGVDARGDQPDGSKAQLPPEPELLAQIFKAEVGEEGDPFVAKSGSSYVVKVDGVRPPKLKPLDTVRAEATAEWQKEQLATRLAAKAKSLAAQASGRKNLAAAAASVGAQVQTSGVLHRPGPNTPASAPFSKALLGNIFSVPAGQAVYGSSADGNSDIVALVTSVQHPPAMVISDAQLRRFAGQIGQRAGQDIGSALAAAARAKVGVSINQQTVDRLIGESS
jgi:peptidyl-prolyl cis-trans isomerase D